MLQVGLGFCILLVVFLVGLVINIAIEEKITFYSCFENGFIVIVILVIFVGVCYAIGSIFIS